MNQDAGAEAFAASSAEQQLSALNGTEQDIAQALQMASTAMSLLTVPVPVPEDEELLPNEGQDVDPEERESRLEDVLDQYFQMLDNIHLSIRTTLATLRAQRVSPALLTDSTGREPPTYGASIPPENAGGDKSNDADRLGLGLYERRRTRDAWENVSKAMAMLRKARQAATSTSIHVPDDQVEEEAQPP